MAGTWTPPTICCTAIGRAASIAATKGYRYLSLYIFCREHMLRARLRPSDGDARGVRDAALVGVASHALLRVSEVSGLDVEDLAFQRDGSALVSIRRSKTDQYGEGAVLHVCRDAVGRLKRWMAMAGIESGPLFRPVKGARSRRRVSDPAPSERRSSAGRRRPASPGGSRAIRYASAPPSRWPSAACRWRSCR